MVAESVYTASDLVSAMDAMRVVAKFISGNSQCQVIFNNEGNACADIEKGVIYIPRIGEASHEDVMKLRTFTYHEGGHILETKMDKNIIPTDKVLFRIYNFLEDYRMEAVLMKRYEGVEFVLDWATDYFNRVNGAKFQSGEVESPLFEALCGMLFTAKSRVPSWVFSPKAQHYFDVANPVFQKVRKAKSAKDALTLAEEIYDLLKNDIEQEKKEEKEQSDFRLQNQDGDSEETPLQADQEQSAESILEKDMEGAFDFVDDMLRKDIEKLAKTCDNSYTSSKDGDEFKIPCVSDNDSIEYANRRSVVGSNIMGMSRNLEQALRALARSRKNPRLEHGKIDMRRLTDISKSLSKKVFYSLREGEKLDTCVGIAIDESGSMDEYLEVQLLAISLAETLSSLGVPFEIFGATTKYSSHDYHMPALNGFIRTNPIVYSIYKTFGEPWHNVKERILRLSKHSHHIDGEVVEFVATRLLKRREMRKIIFSLSDGAPCGGQSKDSELGSNLIRVTKSARKRGIEVYGFGIRTRAPEQYYGKENFIHLDDVEKMDEKFFRTFGEVITKGRYKV